jgi:hypothetical protein
MVEGRAAEERGEWPTVVEYMVLERQVVWLAHDSESGVVSLPTEAILV